MGLLGGIPQQNYYTDEAVYGNYQFTSLKDIVNHFLISHVGEDKIISKVKRSDVIYHAKRAMQELSFDTFKSCKSIEVSMPPSLQMALPQDYVNWTKISWSDSAGIKHRLYPTTCKASNPPRYQTDSNGDFLFDSGNLISSGNLLTGGNLQGGTQGWNLNVAGKTGAAQSGAAWGPAQTPVDTVANSTGWHWYQNKFCLYNGVNFRTIRYTNLPIYSGEKYSLTFTLSNYVAGNFSFYLIDENSAQVQTANYTADGTYTVEIDMSTATLVSGWDPQILVFRNDNTGSGTDSVCIDDISLVRVGDENESTTWSNYSSTTPSENQDDYDNDTYWRLNGERYGLDPQHAQANGSFFVDCAAGKIHFSSNISGKTIVLDYLSDGLGTDEEMKVHKFAEEAMYKHIAYGVLSTRINTPEYIVQRFKKERFAETRKAKLRLSNIKLEEITQILRGKSKHIKH